MVEILESCMVVPSKETPKHKLWLSNLDVVAMRGHTPVLHVYRRTGVPPSFAVDTVKSALAEALAIYYPLAGKLAADESGRVVADCTGEGALFVAANSDEYAVEDVDRAAPTAEMRRLLVPAVESHEPPCTVLVIQVTFLRCGGMILGTAVHHAVADGLCFFEFIKTMSDIARHVGGTQPVSLALDRSLLHARPTPTVTFDHPEYSPVSSSADDNVRAEPFDVALFELSKDQLRSLKLRCSDDRNPAAPAAAVSTFQAVAAHAWRCACIARGLLPSQETRLHTIADVRGRLKPPLPPRYLGNAAVRVSVTTKVGALISYSIRHGAEHIGGVLNSIGDEYVRSVVDYVEVTGISRLPAGGKLPRTDLRIVSWLSLQLYAGDFGWGPPIYVARPHFSGAGHGYIVRSPRNDGGVGLTLSLELDCMERFKQLFYDEICNEKEFSKCLRKFQCGKNASSL